jgi:SAM-dependent methyltransferase
VDPADTLDGPQPRSGWESPECVARFAERDADHRLRRIVDDYADPAATAVLDLGCAAGRNTALLCERGFDVIAVDSSHAMIEYTRARVASLLGEREAERRVRHGRMDDLSWAEDGCFELILAFGIFHEARTDAEWDRALAESARVLRAEGRLLVATFTAASVFDDHPFAKVEGTQRVHRHPARDDKCLTDPAGLDADMAALGLAPVEPTELVTRKTDNGQRVTINGFYVKSDG